jgi:hypothetical protein
LVKPVLVVGHVSSFKYLGVFLALLAVFVVDLIDLVVVTVALEVLVVSPCFDIGGLVVGWECFFG